MSQIRTRVLLLTVAALTTIGGFGYLTYNSFYQFVQINKNLSESFYLEDFTKDLNVWKFDRDKVKLLKVYRSKIRPEHRSLALSNIIQAYTDKNPGLLKKRIRLFAKNEKEYRNYLFPMTRYLNERINYYGIICLGSMVLCLLVTILYLQRSLFDQLKQLSKKMLDFLNHRYTYQFSVPAPNEVGHLQATFNALAQRVLNNMEELKSLDRAKSEFLSICSHELRTPLTSIKGSLSLLKSGVGGDLPKQTQKLVNIAETETDRLIRLINDILDLAKIEARKLPLSPEWSSLKDLLDGVNYGLQGLAQQAQVAMEVENSGNIEVHMDRDRIQQVVTNLASNAIKYSPKNGIVTITCEQDERDHLKISVSDQGKGIAPEDQEIIFEQFRQATGPDNPLVKGTGLGLAIAKALVEEHGGQIGVESVPGEGSTFYFSLPKWRFSLDNQSNETDENTSSTPPKGMAA